MKLISERTINEVNQVHVLDLAQRMGHWTKPSGVYTTVFCPNPNHHENTPDCKIKNSTGIFTCYGGGGCGAKGGPIQYYSWATSGKYDKSNFVEAVKGVCEVMGIPLIYSDGTKEKGTGDANYTYTPKAKPVSIPPQPDQECDKVYRRFLSLCPLYREHAEEWILKRKYSKEQILAIGLKSIPATYKEKNAIINTLLKEGYNLERIPGFTKVLRKDGNPSVESHWYWTMNAYGKYFIPVRNELGYIVRMRLATGEEKKKYTWFSSEPNVEAIYEDGKFVGVKDLNPYRQEELPQSKMKLGGCSSSHQINVVIPSKPLAAWEVGTEVDSIYQFDYVLVTEGEHKSHIVAEKINQLVIGVPGVGLYKEVLTLLRSWNVKKLVIAYDADAFAFKEDEEKNRKANAVFKNLIDFSKEILESDGIELYFWIWSINDAKGLDDLFNVNKLPIEVNVETRERKPCDFLKLN